MKPLLVHPVVQSMAKRRRTLSPPPVRAPPQRSRSGRLLPPTRVTTALPMTGRAVRKPGLAPPRFTRRQIEASRNKTPELRRLEATDTEDDGEGLTSSDSSDDAAAPAAAARRTRVLQQRATRRRRQMVDTLMARGTGQQTFLEIVAVHEPTEAVYRQEAEGFLDFADRRSLPLGSDGEVDGALVEHMNALFASGQQASAGDKLLAGLLHFAPEWGRFGSRTIPRSWRALRGWRRRCPSRSRRPWPLGLWCALAWVMAQMGEWMMCIFTMYLLSTYMRPGELKSVRRGDLVRPAAGMLTTWAILLCPSERRMTTKVGSQDESIALDCRWTLWDRLVSPILAEGEPDQLVFPFSYSSYCRVFRKACQTFQISGVVPYQARHSGTAHPR